MFESDFANSPAIMVLMTLAARLLPASQAAVSGNRQPGFISATVSARATKNGLRELYQPSFLDTL